MTNDFVILGHYGLNVCTSPRPNSYVKALIHKVMVFGVRL